MTDDFTCILRDEFKRFIEELPYEELRQSIFTEELEVADRLLALSESYVLTDITVPRLKDAKEKHKFAANPF